MRRKITRRVKKELRKLGCTYSEIDTSTWADPKAFAISVIFRGNELICSGRHELETFKHALKLIKLEKESGFCTENGLWHRISPSDCDFEGWAVLDGMFGINDCNIAKDAFAHQHCKKIPITWNHNHECVLGRGILEHRPGGMYFYGWFLEDPQEHIRNTKRLIQNGDVKTMSIMANHILCKNGEVTSGNIIEVGLVLFAEQPPEYQDTVITRHKDWNDL